MDERVKYLAFDIEAANGYRLYSICSIGFVAADENFNIIEQRNIWCNPKTKYDLNGTRKNIGINLNLDEDLLNRSPDFTGIYPEIKTLLENPTYTVVGHAVESDVHMLNAACHHWNMPSLNFDFICSQLLYKLFTGAKEVRSLGKIADDMGIEFRPHASDEDARVSLLTLKYITEKSGLSVDELLKKYCVRRGSNFNFTLTRTVSLTENVKKKKKQREAKKAIVTDKVIMGGKENDAND